MTIDLLDVNLAGVFEYGQAYVALSRAVALESVRVRSFRPELVKAHPTVTAYYDWLAGGAKGEFKAPGSSAARAAPMGPNFIPSRPPGAGGGAGAARW